MLKQLVKWMTGISCCLMVSGCVPLYNSEYYIPVDNQVGDAKSLSKDDVIRVVATHNYLDVPPPQQPGWTDWGYFVAAREKTALKLQELGYNVINMGDNPQDDGHPTVIALVDSSPVKGTEEKVDHNFTSPLFTDEFGKTTQSEVKGITITYNTFYYKVKLIRPQGKDNPLLQCKERDDNMKVCIASVNPSNYKTIFSGYATITTNETNSITNVMRLTTAVFDNYPNMMGKKWVYFPTGGYTPLFVTDPNAPKPTDKK